MSVPAWKQAIIERRKRHEDDQKKKQAEEEAYLATLPPWKRALFQKREKERRQKEEEKERARAEESCERSSSFQKRQQQLAHEREQRKTGAWGRRVTPPSPTAEAEDSGPTSPYSPPYDHSHHFFPTATNSQQPSHERSLRNSGRRASVTTVDAPVHVAEKVANTPMPPPQSAWESRPRASSKSSASSSAKKVISSVKKFDEIRTQSGNDMPAWKKALLQRRKEKAGVGGGGGGGEGEGQTHMPSEASLSLTRKESPQVGVEEEAAPSSESVSLLAIKRKPSPKDEVSRNVQEGSAGLPPLQRRQSPVEQMLPAKDHNLGRSSSPDTDYMAPQQHPHNQSERPPHGKTHPKKEAGQKSLDFRRKTSPVEVVGTRLRRSESPLETRDDVSSRVTSTDKSQEQSTAVDSSDKTETANKRPAPKRTAPVAPSNTNTRSAPLPPSQQKKAPSTRAQQQKPAPEIVNLGASEPPPLQSKVIQTEGITHRAPVYKEVGEWANVSEDDPRFLSLPMWKQALIKRRRADIAKRMGLTTSVDDVLLTNGPVRNQGTTSVPSQDHSALPWKNKMVQHKVERGSSSQSKVADREKKRLANKSATSNNTSSSTVKSLLGRFSPSPPPTTSPAPAITITSRSPSPSSYSTATPTATPTASSRPAPSSTGVPPTKSSAGGTTTTHATRRSFTWTPGEDSIPGETLSDDSSNEEEDETITNLDDDTSSSEEEKDKDDDSSGVVLLKPPQAISSPAAREGPERVRKTSSILIGTNHPKKHVSELYVHILNVHSSIC